MDGDDWYGPEVATFGDRVAAAREASQMTQEQLAKRLGVKLKTLQPWEEDLGRPAHIASALDIMLEGPVGGASFNNEYGRPNLWGYFRFFEEVTSPVHQNKLIIYFLPR